MAGIEAERYTVQNADNLSDIPVVARLLGWGGVIPFAFFAAAVLAGVGTVFGIDPRDALIGYAAVILSFMGAVHWGLALSRPANASGTRDRLLTVSVLPALVAWAALLMPFAVGLATVALAFAALFAFDVSVVRSGIAPSWYRALRWQLTLAVLVCLLAAGTAELI